MALQPGDRLGPYEILAPICAGGMGEVYRARDTRLGREVAIKVSHSQFTERFEREARVIATLNHSNICTLHDIGPNYLVMELIDGVTLAERIEEGAMPVEEAVTIAAKIADALEAAHEKGIVHRDLKPANIKITSEGSVKVLDFGLAKTAAPEPTGKKEEHPTISLAATQAGSILGTPAYMSPEQARGKPVDKRTDIWAFGCVVVEILTGRQAFRGDTTSDLLATVIKEEPKLDGVPAHLRPALEKCLRKDPRTRSRAIGDARNALEEAKPETSASAGVFGKEASKWPWPAAAAFALIALALTVTLTWNYFGRAATADQPLMRFSADLGPDAVLGPRSTAAISPDGTRLAFVSRGPSGKQQLATRRLDQENPTLLPGTENAVDPFFSPDSQWIGFFAEGDLKKVAVQGGAAVTLCSAGDARGANWGEDGNIIFNDRPTSSGLLRVSEGGGTPQTLTTPLKGEYSHRWPQILPGGDAVLFTSTANPGDWENGVIDLLSLKTGKWKTVQHDGYFGRYLPTGNGSGHLLYVHQGTVFGVPLDMSRGEVKGTPVPLLENVLSGVNFGSGNFDVSRDGIFVYAGGGSRGMPLALLESDGRAQSLLPPAFYNAAHFSPDGKRIVVVSAGDVQVFDRDHDRMSRLTVSRAYASPIWAPDGHHIVAWSAVSTGDALQWFRSDGTGAVETLFDSKRQITPYSFSQDGTYLAFTEVNPETAQEIWILPLDLSDPDHPKPGKPQRPLTSGHADTAPAISPDGKWIAYSFWNPGAMRFMCGRLS